MSKFISLKFSTDLEIAAHAESPLDDVGVAEVIPRVPDEEAERPSAVAPEQHPGEDVGEPLEDDEGLVLGLACTWQGR